MGELTIACSMLAMCTAWCVALGGTTAVVSPASPSVRHCADESEQDTIASAVFTSNSPKTDVGVILQRCFICLGILYIPFAVLWWFIHPVLLLLGQTDELSRNCQAFLRVLSFGAPGYIAFESVKKYLQVQGQSPLVVAG